MPTAAECFKALPPREQGEAFHEIYNHFFRVSHFSDEIANYCAAAALRRLNASPTVLNGVPNVVKDTAWYAVTKEALVTFVIQQMPSNLLADYFRDRRMRKPNEVDLDATHRGIADPMADSERDVLLKEETQQFAEFFARLGQSLPPEARALLKVLLTDVDRVVRGEIEFQHETILSQLYMRYPGQGWNEDILKSELAKLRRHARGEIKDPKHRELLDWLTATSAPKK
jgi:hypothetical protein